MSSLAGEIARALKLYAGGQLKIAGILTILYAAGYAVAGLPLWPLIAILSGALFLVPLFGSPAALLLALASAWLGGLSFTRILIVVGIYVIVQTAESYFITPRILGRRLGLRPLAVFVVVLIAGSVFGFFGLLLAVPVLAVLNVVARRLDAGRLDVRRLQN